jgi:hypothetical protein
MKNLLQRMALAIGCLLIMSCDKDQKLIGEIEGEYKIESLINYSNGKGNAVSFTEGRIYFEDCKMKDEFGGMCSSWYQFDGKPKVTLQYQVEKRGSKKVVQIINLSSLNEPIIMGDFEFKMDGNDLILDGLEQSGSANGVVSTYYSDVKLSRLQN